MTDGQGVLAKSQGAVGPIARIDDGSRGEGRYEMPRGNMSNGPPHDRHESVGFRRGECGGELFCEKYVVDCDGDASEPGR